MISLHEIMNELRAHDPSLRPPPAPEPDIRRQATGPGDRNARSLWVHNRNELLEWIRLESRMRQQEAEKRAWQRLLCKALEKTAELPMPPADSGREHYTFHGDFAGLCCYDLFVHVAATLLANSCHGFLHQLLARRYYVHGSMLAFICFWSGEPENLPRGRVQVAEEDKGQSVAEFVSSRAQAGLVDLMQTELLLFVAGMALCEGLIAEGREASRAETGYFCWDPLLFMSESVLRPLPFFQRLANREGMEDFMACLGIEPSPAAAAWLIKMIDKYLEKRRRHLARGMADFTDAMNVGNWHRLDAGSS